MKKSVVSVMNLERKFLKLISVAIELGKFCKALDLMESIFFYLFVPKNSEISEIPVKTIFGFSSNLFQEFLDQKTR